MSHRHLLTCARRISRPFSRILITITGTVRNERLRRRCRSSNSGTGLFRTLWLRPEDTLAHTFVTVALRHAKQAVCPSALLLAEQSIAGHLHMASRSSSGQVTGVRTGECISQVDILPEHLYDTTSLHCSLHPPCRVANVLSLPRSPPH